jgi:ribosomal protein S18 acetylase RimI-like enzyme
MAANAVLRMRRDLSEPLEQIVLPAGVAIHTLTAKPDKALLRAAHAVLTAGYWEGGGGAPIFRQWWKVLRTDSEYAPELVFLAADVEGVAGIAQCWTSSFVKDLAVHPRARRRGIGKALMLQAFHAFAQRGEKHVDLKVRAENTAAIALYESLRMRVVGREDS